MSEPARERNRRPNRQWEQDVVVFVNVDMQIILKLPQSFQQSPARLKQVRARSADGEMLRDGVERDYD